MWSVEVFITIPSERYRSLKHAREFLYALLDPQKTPRVPKKVRIMARNVLRHYPADFYLEKIKEKAKGVLGE